VLKAKTTSPSQEESPARLVTPYSAELPVMLAKASAIWNPIVYALKHPRYRSTLSQLLPKKIRARCCMKATSAGDSPKTSMSRRSYELSSSLKHQAEAHAALDDTGSTSGVNTLQGSPAVAAAGFDDDRGGVDTHTV